MKRIPPNLRGLYSPGEDSSQIKRLHLKEKNKSSKLKRTIYTLLHVILWSFGLPGIGVEFCRTCHSLGETSFFLQFRVLEHTRFSTICYKL